MSPSLSSLIHALGARLVDGRAAIHQTLREQWRFARVRDVELTGVGFFATFDVPRTLPALARDGLGGSVAIEAPSLPNGAGALLCVEGGYLAFIEVYTYGDDPFPDDPREFTLRDAVAFGEPPAVA